MTASVSLTAEAASMTDIHEELAAQYALARRTNPLADVDGIANWITDRLNEDQRLSLAEEALVWTDEPANRRELARSAVLNFVLAMEGG
jgi:hypothetical protein